MKWFITIVSFVVLVVMIVLSCVVNSQFSALLKKTVSSDDEHILSKFEELSFFVKEKPDKVSFTMVKGGFGSLEKQLGETDDVATIRTRLEVISLEKPTFGYYWWSWGFFILVFIISIIHIWATRF